MQWTYGSDSPMRDSSISIEEEVARLVAPQVIPWRFKFMRLWRFLIRRKG